VWTRVAILFLVAGCKQLLGFEDVIGGDADPDALPVARHLVFDNSASADDLIGFPVLVILDPTRIDYAAVPDPERGFSFTVPGSSENLPYEIDTWDPGGRSFVWVRVPAIAAGSTTDTIIMTYGGSLAAADPAGVWTGSELVQHMRAGFENSASSDYQGTPTGPAIGTGQIGTATVFDGTAGQNLTFVDSGALVDGWSDLTLEIWLRPTYTSPLVGEPRILEKQNSLRAGRIYSTPSEIHFQVDVGASGGSAFPVTTVDLNAWSYLAVVCSISKLELFHDGGLPDEIAIIGPLVADPAPLVIGSASTVPLTGEIDELRIAQVARSAAWIHAQYLTMTDQFVTFADP